MPLGERGKKKEKHTQVKGPNHSGVLLLPPGQDRKVTPSPQQYVASTHLYTWVRRDKME